jgi:hypothetical protein
MILGAAARFGSPPSVDLPRLKVMGAARLAFEKET